MICPPELVEVVSEILQEGLLRIRATAWSGDNSRCAIEADHLHNLPALLANYSPDLLRFYWDVERVAYRSRVEPGDAAGFSPLWNRLEGLMQNELLPALS